MFLVWTIGAAQWLGCRSLTDRLSLSCDRYIADWCPLCG